MPGERPERSIPLARRRNLYRNRMIRPPFARMGSLRKNEQQGSSEGSKQQRGKRRPQQFLSESQEVAEPGPHARELVFYRWGGTPGWFPG